jgi:hypothetical protein
MTAATTPPRIERRSHHFCGRFASGTSFDIFLKSSTVISEDLNSLKSFDERCGVVAPAIPGPGIPGGVPGCHADPVQYIQPTPEGLGCQIVPLASVTCRLVTALANWAGVSCPERNLAENCIRFCSASLKFIRPSFIPFTKEFIQDMSLRYHLVFQHSENC